MTPRNRLAEAQRRLDHAYRRQRQAAAEQESADAESAIARSITDLTMRLGELCLASGAGTARTTQMLRHVARAYGLPIHVDVTYTRIILSYQPSIAADPITIMRSVAPGGVEYDRLTRLETLVARIEEDRLPLPDARDQLRRIVSEPRVYRRWVLLVAAAVMGGAVAMLLGGSWADILVAFLATGASELVRSELVLKGLANFFAQAAAAAVPTLAGLLVMATAPLLPTAAAVAPSMVIAAGMVALLAGLGVVTAAGDAIDGYYISAGARVVEVTVMTGGIVMGLVLTLWLGLRLGVPAYISPAEGFYTPTAIALVSAGIIAASFGVLCNMGPRSLVVATGLGVVLWAVYELADAVLVSYPARVGVAALLVGFLSRLVTRPLRIPMVAMITVGIAPLMPGLLLYRAIYGFTSTSVGLGDDPSMLLMTCSLTALALAAGSGFGANLAGVLLRLARMRRERAVRHARAAHPSSRLRSAAHARPQDVAGPGAPVDTTGSQPVTAS
ncbi:threonine/serine ThrE exporter family protein [Luteococcus peritonei]|uniref:Threonine/serine exporter ThrE family protein n=1 Tax=Luteococcus peritonei TaxID=88874 RepID=A0ABW4RT90_9ACTN